MATAIVVGFCTGAMKPVLQKLATLMGDEFSKVKNVRKDVEFLSDELTSMNVFLESLEDVDELDAQTKLWRNKVRNMSYDIENIIDDFKRKIGEKGEKDGLAMKTLRLLKSSRARQQIAGQIEEIKKLVSDTSERHKRYESKARPSSDVTTDPRVVTFYQDAISLVGLEGLTDELVNYLKDEETQLKVVSIVGFGGLGKTTLANEVYRQSKGGLECCALVAVTQKPNIPSLLRSLLSEVGSKSCTNGCDENVLINKLRVYLQHKRYLIVIDDLWERLPWDIIKGAFPDNGLGSRVITTTRIHDVAKACCSNPRDYILKMKPLSDEDSRRLFFGRIFNSEDACPRQLRDISIEILKKCGGMPLAIITISGMLASGMLPGEVFDQEEWEHIRNSLGSGTNLTLEGVRKILDLSYKNLPPHLKTCLLYLGMYPEDFEIPRQRLELQWIAEGFVSKEEKGKDVEKVARSYFNELINRSLIQPTKFDNHGMVTHCKVHDMMRDLILWKCAEENFLTIIDDPRAMSKLDNTVHRLSLQSDCPRFTKVLPGNTNLSQVRTFMIFGDLQYIPPLSMFKFLRVLLIEESKCLYPAGTAALAKLYQLRYLAMTKQIGISVPTEIRGLRHLETLDLLDNMDVPSDIVHLRCLMFLNIRWSSTPIPDGIGNMKSLRYLKKFDVMQNSLDNVEGLGELTSLRVLAVCSQWYAASDFKIRMDALCSSLGKICTSLEYLGLDIIGCMDVLMDLSPPPRRLERLYMGNHHENEREDVLFDTEDDLGLCIWAIHTAKEWKPVPGSYFSRVPNWMGELSNLKELVINVLEAWNIGILAQLPALAHLRLYIRKSLREWFVIYAGEFPVLKCFEIRLSSASYLAFQAGAMPKLQWLGLQFSGVGWFQHVPGPAGIRHLSALEEFSAQIGYMNYCYYGDYSYYGEKWAKVAMRNALHMHPNHPRVHITCDTICNLESSFLPCDDSDQGASDPPHRAADC
ncbi:hypothetical protein CFC21_094723 [Triticum aestivum]|uniref:Uncharacterized protein n=2 Tax=Triticum aestivum TaxID=4565 RepID=A0A3B6QL27_WHEAT|nr:disease resistance protein RGA5-like [Triticum aestivum]KAF7092216.1 hypothetical protein CFC21_094723 [Triticum aestivum]